MVNDEKNIRRVSRREFLHLSALTTAAIVAAACTPGAAPAPEATATTEAVAPEEAPPPAVPPSTYSEAPMLAERVEQGELPSVDERLPENPHVAEGLDGIGNYGGNWRMGYSGQADTFAVGQVLARGLLSINQELEVIPMLAESWELSDDATEFTFHLRQNLKWSDGEPLTANDFIYWYEDFIRNEELTPAVPEWLTSPVDGELVPVEVSAPDDYTVVYKFSSPNSLFYLDGNIVLNIPAQPAHYMKQFHADYTEDSAALDQMVADAGYDSWVELYDDKDDDQLNPELPTHQPWIQDNNWGEELVTLQRNPYFWEVDAEGNQLPYIDTLSYRVFQDPDVYALWCVNGEIDCQARHTRLSDLTVFRENEANGDYTTQPWRRTAVFGIHFNMTAKDERLRELFQQRDFRIAVSLGVDRAYINELVYDGLGTLTQYAPPPDSPLYYPELSNAYLEYDPDQANALLDGLGYSEKDADGYRLWNDGSGERIRWTVLGAAEASDEELQVIDFLDQLGFELNYRGADRSLRIAQHNSNDVQCTMSYMDRNLVPLADPQVWVKHENIDDRPWANAWTAWRMDPTLTIAEEPPEGHWIWDIWDLWDQIRAEADDQRRNDLFKQILAIWAEELPSVGFFGDLPKLAIVKNGFKGIHANLPWDCCSTVYEHIIDNGTWYWDDPAQHQM